MAENRHEDRSRDESTHAQRVHDVFIAALDLPESERETFIRTECGVDNSLHQELKDLLAQRGGTSDDTDGSASGAAAAQEMATQRWLNRTIGGITIRRLIGAGGMGSVFEGVQQSPRRTVAVKILRDAIPSERALRRFEYEAQTLARMEHPGITKIHAIGIADEHGIKIPYFVMEYVRGAMSITAYAKEKALSLRERLELFERVCEAVGHAHQKGVIHRDLKPANILVDSRGHVQVIDFGVARSIDADQAETMFQTLSGQLIGTPRYMAPEQFAHAQDVDARIDVYSLGVILYELLVHQAPYEVTTDLSDAQRVIKEVEPTRPSSIDGKLKGDVEAILLKALEKDRDRRYRDAAALGDDIGRYLNDEPVLAQTPTLFYTLRKIARRNRPLAAAAVFTCVVIFIATIVSGVFYFRAIVAEKAEERYQQVLIPKSQAFNDLFVRLTVANIAEEMDLDLSTPAARDNSLLKSRQLLETLVFSPALLEIDSVGTQSPEAASELAGSFDLYARHAGSMEKQLEFARLALKWSKRIEPPDALQFAKATVSVASALSGLNRYEEAEARFNEAEALLAGLEGREARKQSWYLSNNRTSMHNKQGQLERAEKGYRRGMEIGEELGEAGMVVWSKRNLGILLVQLESYEEAFQLLQQGGHIQNILDRNVRSVSKYDQYNFIEAHHYLQAALGAGRLEEALAMSEALCYAREISPQVRSMGEFDTVCLETEELRSKLSAQQTSPSPSGVEE